MIKRNVFLALIIIISLMCVLPSLVTRTQYEATHDSFEVAMVLTPDMTKKELETFKENGITILLTDETDSEFDMPQLSLAKELGFDIALRINVGEKATDDFRDKLDVLVKENDVKYMLIAENKDAKSFDAPLEKVIRENGLTVVVCETIKQLSNEMPKGYDRYIGAADGRLMRSYESLKNPAGSLNSSTPPDALGELLYHHLANSLVDRNTEFMVLNLIENSSVSRDKAIEETLFAAKKFKETAVRLGYAEGKDISLKGYGTDVRIPCSASVMLAVVMVLISVEILLKKRVCLLEWLFGILAIVSFGITYFMPQKFLFLVPTVFSPLSAIFSFSASVGMMTYVKNKGLSFFSSLLSVFSTSLISLFFGAAFIGSMLSGTDFYLNNLVFRGVKISLILPIIYSFVFIWIYENLSFNLSFRNVKSELSKIKLSHIIVLAVAAMAVFVYITRSGNAKISPLENSMRNFMSEISGIRPRTKEFLIGWPILALSVYLIHHSSPKLLIWVACVGSSVLFASVTNTFCHVFADFSVSALRTVNGLVFSIPVTALVLLAAKLFHRKKIEM